MKTLATLILAVGLLLCTAHATVDDALSFALQAAQPNVKAGFTVREDYWGGDLPVKQPKTIVQQLFKGNEYWFWMGTDSVNAKIAIHIYDAEGRLAESESWNNKPHMAAAKVSPKVSGSYYLTVEILKSPLERTHWALAYGFK